MAAVSAAYAPGTLTPPSSSHGGATSWDYAVPLDAEVCDSCICPTKHASLASLNKHHVNLALNTFSVSRTVTCETDSAFILC